MHQHAVIVLALAAVALGLQIRRPDSTDSDVTGADPTSPDGSVTSCAVTYEPSTDNDNDIPPAQPTASPAANPAANPPANSPASSPASSPANNAPSPAPAPTTTTSTTTTTNSTSSSTSTPPHTNAGTTLSISYLALVGLAPAILLL